jgi:hypothetical protein
VDTAEDLFVRFDTVTDDSAVAAGQTDASAWIAHSKLSKVMTLSAHNDVKRLVVFVLANFACRHT